MSKIIKVAPKGDHSFILTEDGKVYGMGLSLLLGIVDSQSKDDLTSQLTKKTTIPSHLDIFAGPVQDIAAGHYHSVALLQNGTVSWGETVCGGLGNGEGETLGAGTDRPKLVSFRTCPEIVLVNDAHTPHKVRAGSSFSVLVLHATT